MKSVDELRKWADGLSGIWIDPNDHSIIVTTCDDMPPSIDCVNLREHVNAILDEIEREAADMVPMPVDADGMPIHVGDRVQLIGNDPSTVSHMSLAGDGWRVYVKYDGGLGTGSGEPSRIRHYHAPTVEDVLREFASDIADVLGGDDFRLDDSDELFAEYAAKLRLAGDE